MKPYLWVRRSAKNIWIFSEDEQEGLGWFPLYTKPEEECIASKKMTLVDELREVAKEAGTLNLPVEQVVLRAADRIEELESCEPAVWLKDITPDELLAEIKRRMG